MFSLAGEPRRVLVAPHPGIRFAAVSPDGRFAAAGAWNGAGMKVWDLAGGQVVHESSAQPGMSVAFSPDGRWLVTGSLTEYRFLESGSWRPRHACARAGAAALPRAVSH